MKKLLIHICCGPCGINAIEEVKNVYEVAGLFYNPNIFPEEEYIRRLDEARKVADIAGIKLNIGEYENTEWEKAIEGYESEPEGGNRCEICYEFRIRRTAEFAKQNGINIIATTLSISPHKDTAKINAIGKIIEKETGIVFHDKDFKENDGFRKSICLCKTHNIYRQNYCGCRYSMRSR